MAMSPVTLSANINLGFTSNGFIGKDSPILANVIATGAMAEILGKPFDTIDTGTAAGAGVGSAVGLTGIVGAIISLEIQQNIVSSLGVTPTNDMIKMANAIGDSIQAESALATLVTSHNPTAAGTAIITPNSIQVNGSNVGSSIDSTGSSFGFVGKDWPNIAKAIGNAIGNSFLNANAAIVIVGVPSAPTSPFSGPNLISPAGVLA